MVFNDATVESRFLGVARDLMDQTRVEVPLWVSNSEPVQREGPMGKVWRFPDTFEPISLFLNEKFVSDWERSNTTLK